MKKSIFLLATIAVLATCLPVTTNAATQVYDLNADKPIGCAAAYARR